MLRLGRAPAKLNLALEVTGRRADGYHELRAVSQTIDWSDVVALETDSDGGTPVAHVPNLRLFGPEAQKVPLGRSNIAVRAAILLREQGLGRPVTQIALEKRIPPQSGLGGGSADAAAVLRLAGVGSEHELAMIALKCGADVPFSLSGGAAHLGGIGEQISRLPSLGGGAFLLVLLGSVSTAMAYAAADPADFSDGTRVEALATALRDGSPLDTSLFGSGLQPAALRAYPELSGRWRGLQAATPGARWAMTGSGGAFFSYQRDAAAAAALARVVAAACPDFGLRVALPLAPYDMP